MNTLSVTTHTGETITRKTKANYTHVATDGFYATWHTRKDLAEKSAQSYGGSWYVLKVGA